MNENEVRIEFYNIWTSPSAEQYACHILGYAAAYAIHFLTECWEILGQYVLENAACISEYEAAYHIVQNAYLPSILLCNLKVAPYNTFYPQLEEHLNGVGIDPTINKWDEPMALGVVDPHDSLSHPAGVSDVQTESASRVDPDQFINFLIPNCSEGEQSGSTKDNPFPLPDAFLALKQRNHKNLEGLKQILREADLEESRKKELTTALHGCFKDWLYASGNIRQLYFLQND